MKLWRKCSITVSQLCALGAKLSMSLEYLFRIPTYFLLVFLRLSFVVLATTCAWLAESEPWELSPFSFSIHSKTKTKKQKLHDGKIYLFIMPVRGIINISREKFQYEPEIEHNIKVTSSLPQKAQRIAVNQLMRWVSHKQFKREI